MSIYENVEQKGYFAGAGRQAATQVALPLLGTYFSRGFREKLREAEGGVDGSSKEGPPSGLEQAVAGLRFRVALSAGEKLVDILESVRDRPNFRYSVKRRESVGVLAGKLDVNRWVARGWEVRSPETYPVLRVERSSRTPENLLAAYSLLWMILEIEDSYIRSGAPPKSSEGKAATDLLERLDYLMGSSHFSDHQKELRQIGTHEWAQDVLEEVESRLSAGRVGSRETYESLVDWIRRTMSSSPVLRAGEIEWLFYDSSFDTTLFELWCLIAVGDTVSQMLCQDRQIPDMRTSSKAPSYRWIVGDSEIVLHFQYDLANTAIGGEVTWERKGGKLGGRPDLTAVISPVTPMASPSKHGSVIYIDPKLRKRDGVPTEEVYKLLGYFSNSGVGTEGLGAILFYTPHRDPQPIYDFTSTQGGRVLAIGLDPERPNENRAGLEVLASLIVQQAHQAEVS
ncbi:hypothetical protein GT034_17665 [Streptomyces sp. SID2563]|uniref:hypothetical protein n=1 Tax=Streptomyces sp. SID2563 TaxID=2690255 RepID=UPI00136B2C3A|nr:hypothetical protein [Streptomyces sp. SID2563]MYW10164.1 hypothetical protein [Streptomyces sp. SID2563]